MTTRRATYRWLLRDVMADHGLFATTALVPLLDSRGIELSPSQVHRLVTQEPQRLSLPILAALRHLRVHPERPRPGHRHQQHEEESGRG